MSISFSWIVLQSRRGQKELDLILEHFNTHMYGTLNPDQKKDYHQFLQSQDHELWDWFFNLKSPPPHFAELVKNIVLTYSKTY